ncbi:MAG: DNA-binding domain-containing protein [Paludibacteraceae bacterium]
MPLKYSLTENLLTERPDDYSAQTHSAESYGKEKFIKRLLGKGTLVTETDALAVLNIIESTVREITLEGGTINLPLFNTSFSISGVFESPLDMFDANRHKLNVNITKGTLLRDAEKEVTFEKTTSPVPQPQIQEVKDSVSGKTNETLTPGGIIEVRGYNIKVAGGDAAAGLWFISESGAEVKATILAQNKPSLLIAQIPVLAAGNWQVKIITQYSGSNILQVPKIYVYPKALVVT